MTGAEQVKPTAEQLVDEEAVEQVERDIEALLEEAQREASEYLELAQRTQADFENYRKRVSSQAAEAELRGRAKISKELLPVLDNFERALAVIDPAAPTGASLADGVRLVHSELIGVLSRAGVESYEPLGEIFDPNLHEAVMTKPDSTGAPDTIIEVVQKGYRLKEGVLRPARVVVAAASE